MISTRYFGSASDSQITKIDLRPSMTETKVTGRRDDASEERDVLSAEATG